MEISEIKALMRGGELDDAVIALRELLAETPDNVEAKLLYGTCCRLLGDVQTCARIDDEVAALPEARRSSSWAKYHAMRVAACAAAVVLATSVLPLEGASTLYGISCKTATGKIGDTRVSISSCGENYYTFPNVTTKRTGYRFKGWRISGCCFDSDEIFYPGEEILLQDYMDPWYPETMTIYMEQVWTPIPTWPTSYRTSFYASHLTAMDDNDDYDDIPVVMDPGGASGSQRLYEYLSWDDYPAPSCPYTRPGYKFAGWEYYSCCYCGYSYFSCKGVDCGGLVGIRQPGEMLDICGRSALVATWEAVPFSVYFDANGGYCSSSSQSATADSTYGWLPTPSRTGYTFAGWYTSAWGGTRVTSSSSLYSNSSHTLYAHWTANNYTVYFDANGGSSSTSSKTVTYDSSYGDLPTPTRTGYTFDGWYTSSSGGSRVYSSSAVGITSSQTLYAHWSIITYTVSLNANGGSCGTSSISVSYGGSYGSLPTPSRTGYSFAGWYTSSSGGTRKYDWSSLASNSSHTLYAQWTANPYTIAFNANGGSGSMSAVSCTYDAYATLSANGFSRTGYYFSGWATSSGGSAVYGDGSSVWNLTSTYNGTVTLYAVWTGNPYTVAYDANGGSGSMSSQSFTYGLAQALRSNGFSRTGYRFSGWATSSSGSVAYSNGASVKNLTASSGSTVTLYAKWAANTYTVSFNANGGSGSTSSLACTYDTASTLPASGFSRTGYTFAGWATSSGGSVAYSNCASVKNLTAEHNGNVTLYAKWTANAYSVKFDANGGTGSMSNLSCSYDSAKSLSANLFTRTGYTFAGWSTSRSGSVVYSNGVSVKNLTSSSNGSVTLYAQWTANPYKVRFNANGGTGTMSDESMTYDQSKALSANRFTRTGYDFLGWATVASSEVTSYADGESVRNLSAQKDAVVTLYAVWGGPVVVNGVMTGYIGALPEPLYIRDDIREIADGALAGKSVATVVVHGGVTKLGDRVLASCPQAVAVYFLGNAPSANAAFLTDAPAGTKLYALPGTTGWSSAAYGGRVQTRGAFEFSVSLADRGSSVGSVNRAFGDAYGDLPTPLRAGYTFVGWTRGGALVENETLVTNVVSHALEATWKANGYEVRCHRALFAAIDEEETELVSLTYDVSRSLPSKAPSGYSIAGWSTRPGGPVVYSGAVKNLATVEGDVVDLYANYRQTDSTLQIKLEEVNRTGNEDAAPLPNPVLMVNGRSDWELDFRNRLQAESPGRIGSCTVKFQSLDPRWIAPADLRVVNDGRAMVQTLQVMRANVATVRAKNEGSATGSVSVSPAWKSGGSTDPTTAQVAPDGVVTLTAKPGAGSALAYWQDTEGNVLGSAAALKVSPTKDTQYVAVFRSKTDAVEPELTIETDESGRFQVEAGTSMTIAPQVALASWPVKFTAKDLPKGLKIDAMSGVITGIPSVPGEYEIAVTATSALDTKKSTTATVQVKVANFTDPSIPVDDAYGPFMVGVAASTNLLQATRDCTVTGLPAGLKYDKATGVVSGVPTKAGAATVYFKKGTALASSTFRVAALPAWAQGEFLGRVDNGDGSHGTVSLTVSPAGKISGKVAADGAAGAFAANSYASVDFAGATNLTVEAVGKLGGAPKTLRLVAASLTSKVAPDAACARVEGQLDGAPVALLRNVWKDRAGAPSAAPLAGDYSFRAEDGAPVSLAVDERGGVKVAATFADGHKLSTATSVLVDEEAFRVLVYGAPNVRNFVPEFFALVRLVPHAGGAEPGVAYRNPGVRAELAGSGGGTVSMNPRYGQGMAGRPVALTAKADSKSVFVGWEYDGGVDYSLSPKLTVGDDDVPVRAVFRLKTDYAERPVPYLTEENRALFDNLRVGVAFSAALSVDDACRPVRFSVKNLPAGLKLDAVTGIVSGVPTKAAEGAMVVVATSEANKALAGLASVPVRVAALDDWAVGAFDGGSKSGTATLAIAAGGKIGGRYLADGLTWTLSAPSFKSYASGMYRADIVAKTGKLSTTNEVVLTSEGVSCDLFSAFRNGWREEPLRTLAPSFQNRVVQLAEGVSLKIGAAGVATATGTFVTGRDASGRDVVYSATCSAVLVPLDETASRFSVFLYFPPKDGKFTGFVQEVVLDWDGEQFMVDRP
ncbi:MAG: InlB B-repeat-containing protein [bacterium]|nr:InlB B-repeat-containing protein [bacterium]